MQSQQPQQPQFQSQETQLIHSFPRNVNEDVRFTLRKFKGKHYADLRIWFREENGETYHPTKKGVSVSLEFLPEIRRGVEKLLKATEKTRMREEVGA